MTLAAALGFIGIVWNAFRMAFGTETVRKAAVDIMCKFLLFTFVMALYPKIVYGVLDVSTTMGIHAGGGYKDLNASFGKMRQMFEDKTKIAEREMKNLLIGIADPQNSNGKNPKLAEDLLEQMVSRFAVTEDDKEKIMREMSTKYSIMPDAEYKLHEDQRREMYSKGFLTTGYWGLAYAATKDIVQKIKSPDVVYNDLSSVSKAVDKRRARAIAKGLNGEDGYDSPAVKHAIISLKAMHEVFSANPDYDPDGKGGLTTSAYLFDPFLRNKDGSQSSILSPGGMIKIGVVIADIINYMTFHEFDPDGNLIEKTTAKEKKPGLIAATWQEIQEMILSFLFTVGMIAACVFFAIQYCMTIFEYFIVTSVGIVFVPCILWDGTKAFAAKLVTLFLAYFFKLMLMIFCLFWVYSFFIDMGMKIMMENPVLSLLNVAKFFFTIVLGWVVTQNGPKLATTILNGTPDLSMGEFLRAGGTAIAGAYAAKRSAAGIGNAARKTGAAAHKGLQNGVNTFAGLDAMTGGVSSAVNAQGDKEGWSGGERFRKTVGGVAGLIGRNIKNSAATFFTGVENKGSKEENVSNMGKGKSGDNTGADGKQTYGDAKNGASDYMNAKLKGKTGGEDGKAGKPPAPPDSPPPDTTPRFNGKRDTRADQW